MYQIFYLNSVQVNTIHSNCDTIVCAEKHAYTIKYRAHRKNMPQGTTLVSIFLSHERQLLYNCCQSVVFSMLHIEHNKYIQWVILREGVSNQDVKPLKATMMKVF